MILVLRLREFAELAWRVGKRAAQRLERLSAAAFRKPAERVVPDEDVLAHEPGSDWFIVALQSGTAQQIMALISRGGSDRQGLRGEVVSLVTNNPQAPSIS